MAGRKEGSRSRRCPLPVRARVSSPKAKKVRSLASSRAGPRLSPCRRRSGSRTSPSRTFGRSASAQRSRSGPRAVSRRFTAATDSGKSTALAAIDLLLNAARYCLARGADQVIGWDFLLPGLVLRRQDVRPDGPLELETTFEVPGYTVGLRVRAAPHPDNPNNAEVSVEVRAGADYISQIELIQKHGDLRQRIVTWLTTPRGTGSRPFVVLDAQRRARWAGAGSSPLVEQLFERRTSSFPMQRERWRAFVSTLNRFPTLRGKDISVDRVEKNADPVLFVEERGKTVLTLEDSQLWRAPGRSSRRRRLRLRRFRRCHRGARAQP